jgi:hypothetical protein
MAMRESVRGIVRAVLVAAVTLAAGPRASAQTPPPAPTTAPETPPASPPETPAPAPAQPDAGAPTEAPSPAPPPPAPPPPAPAPPAQVQPEPIAVVEAAAPAPVSRPRLSAAVGMGLTWDAVGFDDGDAREIPAFFTVLGIGDGLFGLDLGAFASEAAGRHGTQRPVDRLALDGFGVVRPAARFRLENRGYAMRVARTAAAELGLGFERDGRGAISGTRFVVHTGARVDLPLSPLREATELRLRLAVRRAFGLYTPKLYGSSAADVTGVGDSAAELYAAIVVVF